ncbi:hypothetical protein RI367_003088 [Sorochytrium milnesiophthora]
MAVSAVEEPLDERHGKRRRLEDMAGADGAPELDEFEEGQVSVEDGEVDDVEGPYRDEVAGDEDEDDADYGVYDEEDDEHSNRQRGRACLPVAFHPIGNPSLPPVCGEEYLRRVREESQLIPEIIVAAAVSPNHHHRETAQAHDEDGQTAEQQHRKVADAQWFERFDAWFTQLRRAFNGSAPASSMERLPGLSDRDGWFAFLYGSSTVRPSAAGSRTEGEIDIDDDDTDEQEEKEDRPAPSVPQHTVDKRIPTPRLLHQLSLPQCIRLLQLHQTWLAAAVRPRPWRRSSKGERVLSGRQLGDAGQWLFALLVRLDDLLTREQSSAVRELAKVIKHSMDELVEYGTVDSDSEDAGDQVRHTLRAQFTLIVSIVAVHFGQRDLLPL